MFPAGWGWVDAKSTPYNCTQHNCHGGLGEKFVFEPYKEEMFQQALQFAEKWNLHTHIQDTQYDHLIVTAGG